MTSLQSSTPTSRRTAVVDGTLIFALAAFLRFGFVFASAGGPRGNFGYDAAVYYTAADALLHGRMPYADFLLVHPPAIMLVNTPFAWIGTLTTDHTGFILANTAFALLGSLGATLVVLIARTLGWPRAAGLLGGAFYAVWYGAVTAQFLIRLEALGDVAILCGVFALSRAHVTSRETGRRRASTILILAGVAFGISVGTEIWYIVPLLVTVGWLLRRREHWRDCALFTVGAVVSTALIYAPFFSYAPAQMWRMVVRDQVGRPATLPSRLDRLNEISSFGTTLRGPFAHDRRALVIILIVVGIGVCIIGAAAWRRGSVARLALLLAISQLIVLLVAPSFMNYYPGFMAGSVAIAIAAATGQSLGPRLITTGTTAARMLVIGAATLTAASFYIRSGSAARAFPGAKLAASVTHVHCLMTDSPMALVELDALTRDLRNNCPNWVDVSGHTYDDDKPAGGKVVARVHNHRWQLAIRAYLTSGDAFIVIRGATGLSTANKVYLHAFPVLKQAGQFEVHSVPGH